MRTGRSGPATYRTVPALLTIILLSHLVVAADCPSDMVAYWSFDDQANPGKELIGLPAGSVNGATWTADGKVGGAMDFDGSDDYIGIPPEVINNRAEGTISAWFLVHTFSNGLDQCILSFRMDDKYLRFGIVDDSGKSRPSFIVHETAADRTSIYTNELQYDRWYHLVATWDSSMAKLYLDAGEIGSFPNPTPPTTYDEGRIGFTIGSPKGWDGRIDEVAIYSRALSETEVFGLFNTAYIDGKNICEPPPECGNGVIEGDEECDVGTPPSVDGCASDCTLEVALCGEGYSEGIVAYWPFDTAVGLGEDIVGSNDGTVNNAALTPDGKVGSALLIAAANQYIEIDDGPDTDVTGALTISTWIKRSTSNPGVIATKYFPPPNDATYHFTISPSEAVLFAVNPMLCKRESDATVNDGEWHHIVGVFEPGLSLDIYLDGELANGALDGTMQTTITTNDKELRLGYLLDGTMDEVAMFHRALSPGEVKLIYGAGRAGKSFCIVPVCGNGKVEGGEECDDSNPLACTPECILVLPTCGQLATQGLVSYWSFDDPWAPGRDEFGTNYGAVSGAVPASGRSGVGMEFDGSDDVITAPHSSDWDLGSKDFTISLWAKYDSFEGGNYALLWHGVKSGKRWYLESDGRDGMNDRFWFYWHDGTADHSIRTNWRPTIGTWHHIVVQRQLDKFQIFIDGTSIASKNKLDPLPDVTADLMIGSNPFQNSFKGLIDEVAVFGRALSEEEVEHLFLAGRAHRPICTQDLPPGLPDGFMPALERAGANTCPNDMARIDAFWGTYCIDRYEANGVVGGNVGSEQGKSPMVGITQTIAKIECSNAGKRLCTDAEWMAACNLQGQKYYLLEEGTGETYGCYTRCDGCDKDDPSYNALTGSHPQCRSDAGVYDMVGNVMEWTDTTVPTATWGGTTKWIKKILEPPEKAWGGDYLYGAGSLPGNPLVRGGSRTLSADLAVMPGCFYLNSNKPPSDQGARTGFRCCSGTAQSPDVPATLEEALLDRNQVFIDCFNEALDLVRQGHPELAISKFQECLSMAPGNVHVSTNIAVLQAAQGPTCTAPLTTCNTPPVCVDLSTDINNCGTCGNACQVANADPKCIPGGSCGIQVCHPGYGDCDENAGNGCEALLNTADNCYQCGAACTGGKTCMAGGCGCPTGKKDCVNMCADIQSDPANCGTCGNGCPVGQVCAEGKCSSECLGATTECGGACVDINTDADNCGACGTKCSAVMGTAKCVSGQCAIGSCTDGYGDCDTDYGNGCEAPLSTDNNCGKCGTTCTGGKSCKSGSCQCQVGSTDCDGDCVNLQTDGKHCGKCSNACPSGQLCANGDCSTECPAGTTACGTACVNLLTDAGNCGVCGTACPEGRTCLAGNCTCPGINTECAGACVDILIDANNCGGCGTSCTTPNAQTSCTTGKCTIASCTEGYGDCDLDATTGCEKALSTSENCGGCGTTCSGGMACVEGACACSSGRTDCEGTCVDIQSNPAHCGACGTACPEGQVCASGSCSTECPAGSSECAGACVDIATDVENCGTCGTACSVIGGTAECEVGACTVGMCDTGFGDCDSDIATGCETELGGNNAHCGKCGNACKDGESCDGGGCKRTTNRANGEPCERPDDCASSNCVNKVCCVAGKSCCTSDADCLENEACDTARFYCIKMAVTPPPDALAGEELREEAAEQLDQAMKLIEELKEKAPDLDTSTIETLITEAQQKLDANDFSAAYKVALDAVKQAEDEKKNVKYTIGQECAADEECKTGNCGNSVCCMAGKVCCTKAGQCDVGESCDIERNYCVPEVKEERQRTGKEMVMDILSSPEQLLTIVAAIVGGVGFGLYQIVSNIQDRKEKKKLEDMQQQWQAQQQWQQQQFYGGPGGQWQSPPGYQQQQQQWGQQPGGQQWGQQPGQ